jgi:2-oxo-4-hydroxy-4-carboxy--5-ureidoimidazoline (OHCU) decarboxylase
MIGGAHDGLPSFQAIFTDQDRQDLVQRLAQQISKTTDQELKKALTELRDAIEHRRART